MERQAVRNITGTCKNTVQVRLPLNLNSSLLDTFGGRFAFDLFCAKFRILFRPVPLHRSHGSRHRTPSPQHAYTCTCIFDNTKKKNQTSALHNDCIHCLKWHRLYIVGDIIINFRFYYLYVRSNVFKKRKLRI